LQRIESFIARTGVTRYNPVGNRYGR